MDYGLPQEGLSFEPPLRVHHLTGGLMMLIAANRSAILFSPGSSEMVFFSVRENSSADVHLLGQSRIRIVGRNHFDLAGEMNDPVAANFAIPAVGVDNQCLAYGQANHWSGLATALHQTKRGAKALLATRVASQIRLCLFRLERLSLAYRTVLPIASRVLRKPSMVSFTSDKYAQYVGSEYRSTLNELFSLRDALLAAAYRLRFNGLDAFTMGKVKRAAASEESGAAKLIHDSMFSEEGDRLVEHMSLYRSVAQHCLGSTNPIFDDLHQILISEGPFGALPYLIYPLYDDFEKMREIERGSSKGILERPDQKEAERFLSLRDHTDALEFCYDCFERLLKIAELLQREIGIEPKAIVLEEDQILELTVTDELGKTRRAKRDSATGRLVEY